MHGNVNECEQDRYGGYCAGAVLEPQGPGAGARSVFGVKQTTF